MAIRTGRRSLYIGTDPSNPMHRLLSLRGDHELSATLDLAVGRYLSVIALSMPQFTVPQWCLVFDALTGVETGGEANVIMLGDRIVSTMASEGLDEKWGVDGAELIAALNILTYAERQAVAELVELFRADDSGDSYTDIIARLTGAFPADPVQRRDDRRTRMSPANL